MMSLDDIERHCSQCIARAYAEKWLERSPQIVAVTKGERAEVLPAVAVAPDMDAIRFRELLRKSGLVVDLDSQATGTEQATAGGDGAKEIADMLVGKGVLTAWQATKLLQGRYQGFFLNDYALLRPLGPGPGHTVYLAVHRTLSRRVAVHVVPPSIAGDRSSLTLWDEAARQQASLKHLGIARVLDLEQAGSVHFMVREYIPGVDLRTLRDKAGPLPVQLSVALAAQISLLASYLAGVFQDPISLDPGYLVLSDDGLISISQLQATAVGVTSGSSRSFSLATAQSLGGQPASGDQLGTLGVAQFVARYLDFLLADDVAHADIDATPRLSGNASAHEDTALTTLAQISKGLLQADKEVDVACGAGKQLLGWLETYA